MLNQEQWSLSCQLHDVLAIALECMFSSPFIEKLCVKHDEHQVLQDVCNKQTKKAARWVQDPLMSVEGFAVHSITASGSPVPNLQARQDRVKSVLGSFVGGVTSPSRWLTAVYFWKANASLSCQCMLLCACASLWGWQPLCFYGFN